MFRWTLTVLLVSAAFSLPAHAQSVAAERAAAQQAYDSKEWRTAASLFTKLADRTDSPADLYNAACSAALAGQTDAAFSLLKRSIDAGFEAYDHLLTADRDLDSLRSDARWDGIVKRIAALRAEHAKVEATLPPPFDFFGTAAEKGYYASWSGAEALGARQDLPPARRSLIMEEIAWLRTLVGDPLGALRAADTGQSSPSAPLSADFDSYRPEPALPLILEEARKTRIVMINEGHHVAQHRVLTRQLLAGLWDQGYRYFAVEAVFDTTHINQHKYPLRRTGAYAQEPLFGDLLRTAAGMGFHIVRYDTFAVNCQPKPGEPGYCFTSRDSLAARNLMRSTFDRDPDARVLVHAGYSHVVESSPGVKALAYWLREWTSIDPLSVDQTQMRERGVPEAEDLQYRRAEALGWLTAPVVLRKPDGSIHRAARGGFAGVDLQVFVPRTKVAWGRSDWMFDASGRKIVPLATNYDSSGRRLLDLIPADGRIYLVQAFVAGETDDAVPFDQLPVKGGEAVALALSLSAGRYSLRVVGPTGEVARKDFEVK